MASSSPFDSEKFKCNVAYNDWNAENNTLEIVTYNYNERLAILMIHNLEKQSAKIFFNLYSGGLMEEDWTGNVWVENSGHVFNSFKKPGIVKSVL